MALIDNKINAYANPVSSLPDKPSQSGMSAAQLKAAFDANANGEIKAAINGIIDCLLAITDGASGADNIGATAIVGVDGTTVQAQLESIKLALDGVVLGQIPDNSLTDSKLNSDIKIGSLANLNTTIKTDIVSAINNIKTIIDIVNDLTTGGTTSVLSAEQGKILSEKTDKLLVNDLLTQLRMTINTTNIDAWADLLGDASLINAGASSGYVLSGGQLSAASNLLTIGNTNLTWKFGSSAADQKAGQTFIASVTGALTSCTFKLKKSGTPTDNLIVELYETSGGLPTNLIATSTTTISGGTITVTSNDYVFNFNYVPLTANTTYAMVIRRSGAVNASNYYIFTDTTNNIYSGGVGMLYNGTTWATYSNSGYGGDGLADIYLRISMYENATVIWNVVTASQVLIKMAVVANQTAGAGTITWYLSDDNTNWVTITNLQQIYNTNFDATSVYLKCIITGDATVQAVAYGG